MRSHRRVTHRLNAVAIRVTKERRVVGRVIVSQTRRALVAASRGNTCIPKRIDLRLPLRLEAPVTPGASSGFVPFRIEM